jgi:magnesium transporter
MIRVMMRMSDGTVTCDGPAIDLAAALTTPESVIWVDMLSPAGHEYEDVLRKTFHFHPLAIEDAIRESHLPKLDDYGTYLYLVFHTVARGDEPLDVHTEEVDVFLGENYLVTIHDNPRQSIEKLWQPDLHQRSGLAFGPAMLLYELLDKQLDSYIPIIDSFEHELEKLGDDIFRSEEDERVLLNRLLTAKSSALRLERILTPQRELLGRLSTGDYRVLPTQVRMYFRDLYDHLSRLSNLAASMRDLASSTIETHLALVNNRMNSVMKVLTMVSTIFIPMSFVVGVYGMNFHYMPELTWPWAYPVLWVILLSIGGGMLFVFWRRKWL